ncbi:type II toxin-antitoxin system VapC family toxin [Microseira sp. BLCC-F43]|uniref:type II toxin-antitoxin system VapC family toxin n=1 Tax=Microseira sp. BLCC-F43 TaxID=3153602 RepID=UPI0035B7959E
MSAFLLDTHTFIWLTEDDANLIDNLRATIEAADLVYVSIASLWEISIKLKIGKLSLQRSYETIGSEIDSSDILLLPISFADTVQIRNLPLHHRDPFDRMLLPSRYKTIYLFFSLTSVFSVSLWFVNYIFFWCEGSNRTGDESFSCFD